MVIGELTKDGIALPESPREDVEVLPDTRVAVTVWHGEKALMIEEQGPNPPKPAQVGLPARWLRVSSISARAGEVFANRDKAMEWLQTPSPALHGATPLDSIETESGYQEVEHILGRIEYGVLG